MTEATLYPDDYPKLREALATLRTEGIPATVSIVGREAVTHEEGSIDVRGHAAVKFKLDDISHLEVPYLVEKVKEELPNIPEGSAYDLAEGETAVQPTSPWIKTGDDYDAGSTNIALRIGGGVVHFRSDGSIVLKYDIRSQIDKDQWIPGAFAPLDEMLHPTGTEKGKLEVADLRRLAFALASYADRIDANNSRIEKEGIGRAAIGRSLQPQHEAGTDTDPED